MGELRAIPAIGVDHEDRRPAVGHFRVRHAVTGR